MLGSSTGCTNIELNNGNRMLGSFTGGCLTAKRSVSLCDDITDTFAKVTTTGLEVPTPKESTL